MSAAWWRRQFRDRPLIPLLVLLVILLLVVHLARPGIINQIWVTNSILKFADPLAILAACQTLTMLTGGIDMSVAAVATMAGFLMATADTRPGTRRGRRRRAAPVRDGRRRQWPGRGIAARPPAD